MVLIRDLLFSGFLVHIVDAQKQQFVPRPDYFPPTGDDTIAGGIFCISLADLGIYLLRNGGMQPGSESIQGNVPPDPGSGPWPAHKFTDASLPRHTLYAPKNPPKDQNLPFLAFGNGACGTNGAGYENFLLEIASHGYIIAADGEPQSGGLLTSFGAGFSPADGQSKVADMVESVDWALGAGADKFGRIDPERIATMGHSCGGLEAMSVAYHNPKVKFMVLLNIAIFQDNKRYLLKELKAPVAWFIGGPKDMGFSNVSIRVSLCYRHVNMIFRQTRTMNFSLMAYRHSKPHLTPVIWVNSLQSEAARLAKRCLHSWNGSLEVMKSQKRYWLMSEVRAAWSLIIGT
jgi:hypothetical protein